MSEPAATPLAAGAADPLSDHADVIVIGAGIAGASAAAALAAHGTVILVEQEQAPGTHATGRSASILSETSGLPEVCALAAASRPFFESPPDGFADSPLLGDRGLLWVGRAEDAAALDSFAEVSRRVAPATARLTAHQTLARLPGFRAEAVAGGAVAEDAAKSIDTAVLLDGFLRLLRRRGGSLVVSHEAVQLQRGVPGGEWSVHATVRSANATEPRRLRARNVVNAAGAWADVVAANAGVAPLGLQPLRRTAALVPAPELVNAWPLVMDIAGRYYAEPESGGLLVSPADEHPSAPCDARPEEEDVAWALHQLDEATELNIVSVRRAWAGLRTFAPDRLPVVGEDPDAPGLWWLAGQGGAGIKTSPAMAQLLCAYLAGSEPPELFYDPAVLGPGRLR